MTSGLNAQVGRVLAGATTALERATAALARIEAYDAVQPQTWISKRSPQAVLAAASEIDARLAAGETLPLAGLTCAVKDNIDVAGLPTTAACPAFGFDPAASAEVVRRLEAAGAIVVGKTNLDQFATGLVGVRSPYGAPGCVFNRDYISGGSSSGSAVAVAAGLVDFALGTDTAGSGRVPAAFNGCVGFKPTKGRWSTSGLTPACRSLDCITVFVPAASDAALIDGVAAGFDKLDPYSREDRSREPLGARFTVGVPLATQLDFGGDEQAGQLYRQAVARLEAAGGRCIEVDIAPLLETAGLLYSGPWVAERAAAIEDFLRRSPGAIHPVVRTIIQSGLAVTGPDTFRGLYRLQALAREAEAVWHEADVLLLPTTPTIYRIAEVLAEPVALNSNLGRYTNFVNLLDMSALAIPAGFRANGTGFGVTLIGQAFADPALIELGARYEAAGPPLTPPELDLTPRQRNVRLAVVGAHLHGMPLNWQLTSRGGRLAATTRTAPTYRLYAMAGAALPRPALVHTGDGGQSIEVEVYELSFEAFGSFISEVPAPLAIGSLQLIDGSLVSGFVAEPRALERALDITQYGGWRAYQLSLQPTA